VHTFKIKLYKKGARKSTQKNVCNEKYAAKTRITTDKKEEIIALLSVGNSKGEHPERLIYLMIVCEL